jgi:hypothetical protein
VLRGALQGKILHACMHKATPGACCGWGLSSWYVSMHKVITTPALFLFIHLYPYHVGKFVLYVHEDEALDVRLATRVELATGIQISEAIRWELEQAQLLIRVLEYQRDR